MTKYALGQNYPNPFNPTTEINYQIPKDGYVTLKVYDILGNEVKTLVYDFKGAGNYSEKFDATNLAIGIYFYKLNTNNYSSIKKMILAK
ncbi:MAG: T9SS type A sorting domain-containing protein [Ignavibacteriaceae bacterium]|nr:T9SS type A sorting domain-containing protein [Ignavibacteriaceae bacterium]